MPFLYYLCAVVVLIKISVLAAVYDTQPKVLNKNGDLIVEAANGRNISLRLSRDSSLMINNVDIMDRIRQHYTPTILEGAEDKPLDVPSTEQLGDEVRGLQDDITRLSQRLSSMQNRTRSTLRLAAIRRNLGRMRRLSGRILVLEQNIAKDECVEAGDPCKNGGTCYDSYKGYHCECTEGWTGKTCEEDVDECYLLAGTDLGCQNNAVCTNTPGSYKCTCAKGFSGTHCRLRNAICQQYQSEQLCVHGICVPANNQLGYTCICDQGWTRNTTKATNYTTSLACDVDVDECEESKNPCHGECINLPGSFKCGPCPVGYTGNGLTCFDVDECATNNGGCSLLPKVRCLNTEGSYRCGNCPAGWIGDGHSCELAPSNSCDAEMICHPQAKCEYISDMATCSCPHGMFGHGFGPLGCHTTPITDSCEKHICQNNGTCLSTGRSTSCLCRNGYSGALCETVDGCHPNPCQNGGTCRPQADKSFKCSCARGTTGKLCEILRSVCSTIQRQPSGGLSYPTDGATEYAANERCVWIIRTTPSEILNITFTSFDVEQDAECSRDWLQIHDGQSLSSQLIGRFCGKDLPGGGHILSSQHQLLFWFRSDNVTNRRGFSMSWNTQSPICGDTLEVGAGSNGVIRSPGYPGKSPANRECQWEISAPYGYRFVLRMYDITLGTLPNCTGDTLKIYDADFLLTEFCQTTSPEPFRSSSNKLKLHFHTDAYSTDSSFQLHYEVESATPHCGGVFTEAAGLIVGPTEQSTCLYLIQQPLGTQIQLDFIDVKTSGVENCNLESIEIFDGKSDEDSQLSISCGGTKPEPQVSSSNYMLIKYKNKLGSGEFETPFKLKYTRACEFRYFGPDAGVFTTPNYPNPYTEYITCTFHIYGPADNVIHANFTDFSISETNPTDVLNTDETVAALNNATAMADAKDESLTYVDVYLSSTNKYRYYKATPMELISELNKMTIVFHASANSQKKRGLRVQYSFEEVVCGGIYTANEGYFSKDEEIPCKYIFEAPPGMSIKISFKIMPYIGDAAMTALIYGNATGGRDFLLKTATAYEYVHEIFGFNVITILPTTAAVWYDGKYEFVKTTEACGGKVTSLYGVIKSPQWPRPYKADLDCVWIITAPFGNKIELTVQNFNLEPECTGDVLEIRNGKYSNSPLIGRYCGDQIPSSIPSFTNGLYLRFTSDSSVEGAGFHITWQQTETGCGGKLTSFKGSIHSPHLGLEHESVSTCDWLINVAQGSSIALNVTPFHISYEFCRNNSLQIYDGPSAANQLLHFNCSKFVNEGQLHLTSSSNQVLIMYTPSRNTKPEFMLDYETNCNMVLDNIQGVVESPNFPDLYPEHLNCFWDIKAGTNNKIKLAFSHLSLEAVNLECENDYVEVLDMHNTDVLKKYRLCTDIPDAITSEGNHLRIHFVTDYSNSKNGFHAEYSRVGCGEFLSKEFGMIQSPNYPYSVDVECDWYIEVPAGKQIVFSAFEFQLDTDATDCSKDALVVKESKNASVDLLKECSTQKMPSVVTSSTNRIYVHYRSGPSTSRKYFKAFFHAKEASCGGIFRGNSGTITSPNYPYKAMQEQNCKWDISVPESYGINLIFKDFEMSPSTNCSDTSLTISKSTGFTETLLDKYCALDLNRATFINADRLLIEYTSKGAHSWARFSVDYRKSCGGKIRADSGFIRSHATEDCIWSFDVAEGTLISLNILQMDCYCTKEAHGASNCSSHGLGFKVNYFGTDWRTANYTNYYCEQHQSNLVFEASKLYVFANGINFHAKFSTTQHSCGGAITSARGALASPHYPASYPPNVQCTWTISATPGNRLQLQFDEMDIAQSEHCNEDFVEVRTWLTNKLLGVYCGNKLPDDTLTSSDSLWLRFHSSEGSTGNGFKLRWSYAHLNEIANKTSGTIESPPITMVRNEEEPFAWRILIERSKFITLHFEQYSEGLSLYDGYDDTALSIPIPSSPWRFVSSSNVVYLRTDNDNLNYFTIKWNITNAQPIEVNTTSSKCHVEGMVAPDASVLVSSPNYPKGYEPNLDCDWIYKPANANDHVVCEIFEVKLEVTDECSADYLKISTSTDLTQWHEVEKLCNSTDIEFTAFKVVHGTPNIKLDFVSDNSLNRTGFYARIRTKCGANLTQSVGFIEGEKLLYETDCLWHIKVKPNKRILLQLDYPPIVATNNNDCLEYAVIYDGIDEHAPIMPPGKICNPQNVSRIVMNSTSNYLTIKYNLILPRPLMPIRWNLTFREYSECDEEFHLIPAASTINVTSPNYPNVPHPHTECEWRIMAPRGEIIQVEFTDRFDMNARFCTKEFVELFDGSTSMARSLGQYCRKPNILKTTQNILYMRYVTDIKEPRYGFKARISISKCGGSYTDEDGVISSPGYPSLGAYPSNSQCDYAISMPADAKIRLVIQDIHLAFDAKRLKSSEFLEIIPVADELSEQPIVIYGNTTKGTQFDLNVNKVIVRFHTFAKNTQYRGFMLRYNRFSGQCNQVVTGESGHLALHFPEKVYFNSYCRWQITVPKGQRVRLEFLNMGDLKEQNSTIYPVFTIFNDNELLSKITSFDVNSFEPHKVIQSSDNVMLVRILVPLVNFKFRTIRAQYSSDVESPCPSDINEDNPAGLIDIQDRQTEFNENYYCLAKVILSAGQTLAFNITAFEHTRNATARQIVSPLRFRDNMILTNYGENLTEVLQPHTQTKGYVRIVQTEYEHVHRLTMGYRLHRCGGNFGVRSDFHAKQPDVSDITYGAIMCVWTLSKPFYTGRADSEYSLTGNFTFSDTCEREFIVIKEGRWPTDPVKKICRDNGETLEGYVFKKSLTFIVYQSQNYNSQKTQFSMATKKSMICGSETKVTQINGIVEVNKESYRNNQECSWVFYTQPGYYLQLKFFGRFFIEASPNCTNDYLEIQHEEDGLWASDGRYCGREFPNVYNASTPRIQVIFRTNEAITGDGFSLFVRNHCSVTLNVTSAIQRIESPATMAYGGQHLQCDYVFQSNVRHKLINVRTALGPGPVFYSANGCVTGFTVYKSSENGAEQSGEKHCEAEFEERAYSYLRLSYEAYSMTTYTIEYSLETCGGNITTSGTTIRPLRTEEHNQYAGNMNCIWYVTAPADHSIAVRFKYFDTEANYDHVTIYAGHKIQAEERLVLLTGNYTDKPPIVMVDQNQAVINAISDVSGTASGFEAQIVFLANCNERIALTAGSLPVNLARNFKVGADEEKMCHYSLSAPKGNRIRVDIKKLQINNDNSACVTSEETCTKGACNTVEILDSVAMHQASMGKFCSSANTVMISSYGDALLKFIAPQAGQYSFEIILTLEKSMCGSKTSYDLAESENFTLSFPQNRELSYGANTHCIWHVKAEHPVQLHFNYIDLQNTSQVSGKCLDYVEVKSDYSSYKFCGHSTNYTMFLGGIGNAGAEIIFHSDATIEGKGFELMLLGQSNDCNRTRTRLSGSIDFSRHGHSTTVCNDTIMVPGNYNLNFYLDDRYYRPFGCDDLFLRITDLKTNQKIFDSCHNTYSTPDVFTTTNTVHIEAAGDTTASLYYGTSDNNLMPGCGGTFQRNEGLITSPHYADDRNFSDCRWNIMVPVPNRISFSFYSFDMGPTTNCHLDNVKIFDIMSDGSEKLVKTLCGPELPDDVISTSNRVAIVSKKSPNFDGTGWTLRYGLQEEEERRN